MSKPPTIPPDRDPAAREAGDRAGILRRAYELLAPYKYGTPGFTAKALLAVLVEPGPPACEECNGEGRVEHPDTLEQVWCPGCKGEG